MRRRRVLAALLAALLALTACGSRNETPDTPVPDSQEAGPRTLAVRLGDAQDTLDPAFVTAQGGETILFHLYENLMRWTDGGDGWAVLSPGQAESYTVETDYAGNATYTFTLREGIVWSDGRAVGKMPAVDTDVQLYLRQEVEFFGYNPRCAMAGS